MSPFLSLTGGITAGKPVSHERKSTLTPTQRDSVPAKSPVSGGEPLASHSPFDPHQVYRAHLPPHLDPSLFHHPGNLTTKAPVHVCDLTLNFFKSQHSYQ